MITIKFNDVPIIVRDGCSLGDALAGQGYAAGSFAVVLNDSFVSRKDYQEKILNNHDQLVIIQPMQGG